MHEVGSRMEPSLGTRFDVFKNPDDMINELFHVIDKINYIPNDSNKFVFQDGLRQYRLSCFNFDMFTAPDAYSPQYKRRNYEVFLRSIANVMNQIEAQQGIQNLAGVNPANYLMGQILNNAAFIAAVGQYTDFAGQVNGGRAIDLNVPRGPMTRVSQSTLSNRFEQSMTPITPRLEKALLDIFRLYHSGFPWFRRPNSVANFHNNFSMPFDVHNQLIIVNGLNSYVQGLRRVLDPFNNRNRISEIDFTMDRLTYNPVMYDIGQCIMNIPHEVAEHISSRIRSSLQLRLLSYMESATVIMQTLQTSSNKASAINAVMASLSNSAASAAVEPVISAMACNFIKISVDLPMNARPTTTLAIISLMLNGSHVYDNRTIALIHNMYVGMIMTTHRGSNHQNNVLNESDVQFTLIRDKSERHELLPVPQFVAHPPGPNNNNAESWKTYLAHMIVLSHFHGLKVKTANGPETEPLSTSDILNTTLVGDPGPVTDRQDRCRLRTLVSAYQHYFLDWGLLPNGYAPDDEYSCLRNILPDLNGRTDARNIIGSSFDLFDHSLCHDATSIHPYFDQGGVINDVDRESMIPLSNILDPNVNKLPRAVFWKGNLMRALKVLKDSEEARNILVVGFDKDDKTRCTTYSTPLDLHGKLVHVVYDPTSEPELDDMIPNHWKGKEEGTAVLMLSELYVNAHTASVLRVRPVQRPTFYERDFNRSDTRENGAGLVGNTSYAKVKKVMSAFVRVSTNIGGKDTEYVRAIIQQMVTDRFLDLSAYLSEMASVTTLADYCPMGYTSLMHCSDVPIDMNNPLDHRTSSSLIFPFNLSRAVGGNQINMFRTNNPMAPVQPLGNPPNDPNTSFKLETQNYHKIIKLEWSSIAALNMLGVAPPGGPDISSALDFIYDAKAFNHDIAIMKYGARYFARMYLGRTFPIVNKLNTEGITFRVSKYREIMSKLHNIFPVSSTLTSKIDASLDNADLKQNHFHKSNPFIDSSPLPIHGGRTLQQPLDSEQYYTLPFLRTRPISPIYNTVYVDGTINGANDLLVDQIINIANDYINSPVSFLDRFKKAIVSHNSLKNRSVALSRVGGQLVLPSIGQAYIPRELMNSPITDMMWTYVDDAPPNEYVVLTEIGDRNTGVLTGRSHSRVFNTWLSRSAYGAPIGAFYTFNNVTPFTYVMDTGIKIRFSKAKNILDRTPIFSVPEIKDFELEELEVECKYTTPEQYISMEDEIQVARTTPYKVIPILPCNVGPYISRLERRTDVWPAGGDYTQAGAFTEDIGDVTDNGGSCEYNLQALGTVISRNKNPIEIVNPNDYVQVSIDPMAPYDRT